MESVSSELVDELVEAELALEVKNVEFSQLVQGQQVDVAQSLLFLEVLNQFSQRLQRGFLLDEATKYLPVIGHS
jgi:hypothetical protein